MQVHSFADCQIVVFDPKDADDCAAFAGTMDRLAAGAITHEAKPIPVTAETEAAVRAKHPGKSEKLIRMEAQIAATFFGGRV